MHDYWASNLLLFRDPEQSEGFLFSATDCHPEWEDFFKIRKV
jgi:hypothetical protein